MLEKTLIYWLGPDLSFVFIFLTVVSLAVGMCFAGVLWMVKNA